MKVGILTTHASMNYGALLQAYALRATIQGFGYTCDIINYKPAGHNLAEHPIQFVRQRSNAINKALFGLRNYRALNTKIEICDLYKRQYLNPVPQSTVSREDLPEVIENYDVICCGSDQIWNLNLKDNEDGTFMLNFSHKTPSITYAVSLGDAIQTKRKQLEESVQYMKQFKAISVREPDANAYLLELGIDSQVVLDPTLMADSSVWESHNIPGIINSPYIVVYGFENSVQTYDDLIAAAKRASDQLGLPVISPMFTPKMANAGFINYFECGPLEFFNLLQNASFVCSNSYHCLIFSILLNRPFVSVFGDMIKGESRRSYLLSLLGVENHGATASGDWSFSMEEFAEYSEALQRIEDERAKSQKWLLETLQSI